MRADGGPSLSVQCHLLQKLYLPLFIRCTGKQDCLLLLGEALCFPAPFPECLHTSHSIKNELTFKGQLRNHLPHEGIYNSWARKSSRHLFSACIAFLAQNQQYVRPVSPLLRAGSTKFWVSLVTVSFGPVRTVPSPQ